MPPLETGDEVPSTEMAVRVTEAVEEPGGPTQLPGRKRSWGISRRSWEACRRGSPPTPRGQPGGPASHVQSGERWKAARVVLSHRFAVECYGNRGEPSRRPCPRGPPGRAGRRVHAGRRRARGTGQAPGGASTSDVVIVITVTAAERTVRRRPGDGAWRERQDRRARAAGLGAAPSSQKEDSVPTRWPLACWARRPGEGRCPSHACRYCRPAAQGRGLPPAVWAALVTRPLCASVSLSARWRPQRRPPGA